jgi:hypothetical protein
MSGSHDKGNMVVGGGSRVLAGQRDGLVPSSMACGGDWALAWACAGMDRAAELYWVGALNLRR